MFKKITKSPITLIACIILGILTGIFFADFAKSLEPINRIYTALLQICALPIMICAITTSVGKIFNDNFKAFLSKFLALSIALMLVAAIIGVGVPLCMKGFITPSDDTKVMLSKIGHEGEGGISESFEELKLYSTNKVSNDDDFSLPEFIEDTIPKNIFRSLAEESTLQVIFFFIIFGIMLNFINPRYSRPILIAFEGIYKAMYKFVNSILFFLPISIFIMMAVLFSDSQMLGLLSSTASYLVVVYIGIIIFAIATFIFVKIRCKISIMQQLKSMKSTFFVALGTSSKSATLPVAIEDSINRLKLDSNTINGTLPVSSILFPNGKIVTTATLAIYAMVIYEVDLSVGNIALVVLLCVLYGISITGVPAVLSATMLTIILQPLGIPIDVMSLILLSTVQFYAGISTFVGMYSNLSVSAFVAPKGSQTEKNELEEEKKAEEGSLNC